MKIPNHFGLSLIFEVLVGALSLFAASYWVWSCELLLLHLQLTSHRPAKLD
jgi:hypothetical protein